MAMLKLKCQTICLGDIVQKAVYKLIASQLRQAVSGGNLRSNQVGENSSDEACTLPESANVLSSSWLHHHQQLSLVFWWSAKLRLTWRHHQAVSNIDSCVTLFSITASRKERRRKEPGRRHLARVWLEGTLKTLRLLLTRTLMLQMEMPVRVGFIPSRWTGWTQPTALRQCSSWKPADAAAASTLATCNHNGESSRHLNKENNTFSRNYFPLLLSICFGLIWNDFMRGN